MLNLHTKEMFILQSEKLETPCSIENHYRNSRNVFILINAIHEGYTTDSFEDVSSITTVDVNSVNLKTALFSV